MDHVVDLISTIQTQDAFGVWRQERTARQVFCRVDSVTRAEFFGGGRNGLNPEFVFTIFFGDYNGERELVYNGLRYAIYRVYHNAEKDYMELYAERKGGTNGNENAD